MRKAPSFEAAQAVVRRAGSTAQQRVLSIALLKRVRRGATGDAKAVLDTILSWDGHYDGADAAGKVNAGVATWEEFRKAAMEKAISRFGEAGKRFGTGTSSSHVFDFSNGMAFAFRTLKPEQLREAAATAAGKLAERFKTKDPSGWRDTRRMYNVAAQGAGSAPPLPFFDRGTWEQIVELGP
jgi:hypothetical protein